MTVVNLSEHRATLAANQLAKDIERKAQRQVILNYIALAAMHEYVAEMYRAQARERGHIQPVDGESA